MMKITCKCGGSIELPDNDTMLLTYKSVGIAFNEAHKCCVEHPTDDADWREEIASPVAFRAYTAAENMLASHGYDVEQARRLGFLADLAGIIKERDDLQAAGMYQGMKGGCK